MPINILTHSVNSGFSIGREGEHLKYDHFKMYIDQGVHFQIIISKSFYLCILSLSCLQSQIFWNAGTQLFMHHIYFTAWGCMCWASAHHSNVFMFSVLGERSMKLLPLGKPERSNKWIRVAVYWALTIQRLVVMVGRKLLVVIIPKLCGLLAFSIGTSSCHVCYELHEWADVHLCLQRSSKSCNLIPSWNGGNVSNQIRSLPLLIHNK